MRRSTLLPLLAALTLATGPVDARDLPADTAARLGFDPERLAQLDARAREAVDDGIVAGAVLLVQRQGQVAYHRAFGVSNTATGDPMAPDDLFRIASMTKPLTSLGVLMLFEEGVLRASDVYTGRELWEVAVPLGEKPLTDPLARDAVRYARHRQWGPPASLAAGS